MSNFTNLLQQKWFQMLGCLALGLVIGIFFNPSKQTEEKIRQEITQQYELKEKQLVEIYTKQVETAKTTIDKQQEEHVAYQKTMSAKLDSLYVENTQLKQSSKKTKFKLVKPDGTIVEKEYEESNSESIASATQQIQQSYQEQLQVIEDKWMKIHEERVNSLVIDYNSRLQASKEEKQKIQQELTYEKATIINPKQFRPEIGYTSNNQLYIHTSYVVWGPVFLGGGFSGTDKKFGESRIGVGFSL